MLQGAPQFTPGQLLDAGRRAEAEGKVDFAVQFYLHLAEHYGQTPDAAEARTALARMAGAGRSQQVWEAGGAEADARPQRASARQGAIGRYNRYRSGRVLAFLCSGIGWLTLAASLLVAAAGAGAHLLHIAALQQLELDIDLLLRMPLVTFAGAVMVVCGQVVRALFDQANAARELVALERARAGLEQS